MKYLRKFSKGANYQAFIKGEEINLPNVSYTVDENKVYYNPIVTQPNNEIWYYTSNNAIANFSRMPSASESTYPFYDASSKKIAITSHTYTDKGIIQFNNDLAIYKNGNYEFTTNNLTKLSFPQSLTKFSGMPFLIYNNIIYLQLISPLVVAITSETIDNISMSSNLQILVPSSLVESYKNTYSEIASQIQEISD